MKNTSVTLSGHFQQFVDTQISTGNYASASEVIRAGLRLLEEREMEVQKLRSEIQKGIDSGITKDFDVKAFLADMHDEAKSVSRSDV